MIISFYANYRQLVGGKTAEFELPEGSSVLALVAAAIQRYPPLGAALLGENGEVRPHVHIFVNGRDTQYLPAGLSTPLTTQDKIDIFPPVAGG